MFGKTPSRILTPNEVARIPFFYDISDSGINVLADILREKSIPQGQYVFKEGDDQNAMFFILEGTVKVMKRNSKGGDDLLAEISAPNIFGELAIVSGGRRSASIITSTDVRIAELATYSFEKLVNKHPPTAVSIVRKIAETLSTRLRKINSAYVEVLHADEFQQD